MILTKMVPVIYLLIFTYLEPIILETYLLVAFLKIVIILLGTHILRPLTGMMFQKPIYLRSYLFGMMLLVHGRHGTDHLVILATDSLHHSKDFGYKLMVELEVSLSRAMILQPVQVLFLAEPQMKIKQVA